jgi:hypothetical protein
MARACCSVTSPVKALAVRASAKIASTAAESITASSWAIVIGYPFAEPPFPAGPATLLLSMVSTGGGSILFPEQSISKREFQHMAP